MTRLRLSWSLGTFVAVVAVAGWLGVRSFPLQAAPQDKPDGSGVSVEASGLTLLHRVPVAYPSEALDKGIEGDVLVELTLTPKGVVSDAHVLSGPDELRKATLESVLQWHYANDAPLPSKTEATIKFRLPKAVPASVWNRMVDGTTTVKQIDLRLPDILKQKLQGHIQLHEGDQITPASLNDLLATVRETDEHLNILVDKSGIITVVLDNAGAPQRIRVGGNVQQANLIQKVQPLYPLQAKQDHVQGKVQFRVLIGKDGHVQNVDLVSGEPVLADAAKEAVEKWVYKPTLLNGQPVEVVTQVDVNFTLSQ